MTLQRDHAPGAAQAEIDEIRQLTSVIENLISMMSAGNIGSLKLEYGSLRLSLRSKAPLPRRAHRVSDEEEVQPTEEHEPQAESAQQDGHVITAPMIGTFYVAPAPNEPPFVSPGDRVEEGQTIGIIEAMKIMNEIAADRAGTVVEVVAGDGQTVEYGSPLVRIDAA